jgi:hypothetical protein
MLSRILESGFWNQTKVVTESCHVLMLEEKMFGLTFSLSNRVLLLSSSMTELYLYLSGIM